MGSTDYSWGAVSPLDRQRAMWTLISFASPDGQLTAAERRILTWAGRDLEFDAPADLPTYDLRRAADIFSPTCRKQLLRTIVLLVEAKGGPTREDLTAIAYLCAAWKLPEPEIIRRGPDAHGEQPTDTEALAGARSRGLQRRAQAIEAARSGPTSRLGAIALMAFLTWSLYAVAGAALWVASDLGLARGSTPFSDVVEAAKPLLAVGFAIVPPFLAGLALGLRGPFEEEARIGGYAAWIIPVLVIVAAMGNAGLFCFLLPSFIPAGMGQHGVRIAGWFRAGRPR